MSNLAPTLLKAATIVVALTLMSGFVLFRHRGGSTSVEPLMAAFSLDSPETKTTAKEIRIDSSYRDESLPSSKSGMIIPPDHPALQQQTIWADSDSLAASHPSSGSGIVLPTEAERRRVLSSSKLGIVFEPHAAGAIVKDSALKDAKAQDTLK